MPVMLIKKREKYKKIQVDELHVFTSRHGYFVFAASTLP